MYRVTKKYETQTAHRLINHPDKCAHLHGHRYQWEVTVEYEATGFVIDFRELKKAMKDVLGPFDHALILHKDDPLLMGGVGRFETTNGEHARLVLLDDNPSVENMTRLVGEQFAEIFNRHVEGSIRVSRIKCHETSDNYAEWINPVA